jgi:hypothetical protein
MKKIIIYMSILLIVLTGCTKEPTVPEYYLKADDRIGYIIQGSEKILHTHLGTTLFNDFEKKYDTSWNFSTEIEKTLTKYVRGELLNLKKYGVTETQIKNLFTVNDGSWVVQDKKLYNELLYLYDVKAIILIYQGETSVDEFESEVSESGLFSKHTLGFKRYVGVNAYKVKLYILNPNAIVSIQSHKKSELLYHSLYFSNQEKSGFKKPNDIDNITEKELLPLRHSILRMLEDTIKSID